MVDADQSDAVGVDDAMGATKAVGHGLDITTVEQNVMDLRAARGATVRPCWKCGRGAGRAAFGGLGRSSVVGGTRKHEWVAGDKVRIAMGGGAHTTGVVTLPANDHGLWRVRCDGESKTRSVRRGDLFPLPRPLRHLWDASVTYNDRWFESRAELYALLMGRQRRLGKGSVCKWIAGNHIVWRRIAEYALAPVSYLDMSSMCFTGTSPVKLRPDPGRGVSRARTYSRHAQRQRRPRLAAPRAALIGWRRSADPPLFGRRPLGAEARR